MILKNVEKMCLKHDLYIVKCWDQIRNQHVWKLPCTEEFMNRKAKNRQKIGGPLNCTSAKITFYWVLIVKLSSTGHTSHTHESVVLQLQNEELDPSNSLAFELELAETEEDKNKWKGSNKNEMLFFGETSEGNGLYQLILFPRSATTISKSNA